MRFLIRVALAVLLLAGANQAQASFILDFSGFAGGSAVDAGQLLSSLTFAGTTSITQNLGADNTLSVGDTFTQASFTDYSVGYTDTNNVFTVSLGGNGQLLTILVPTLNATLTSNPLPGGFFFDYGVPTPGMQFFYSNTAGTPSTLIGTATLVAPSDGLTSDTLGKGYFDTGTFHLYADLSSLTPGIFKNANGTDLATFLGTAIVQAELDGHLNLSNPVTNGQTVTSNVNTDGEFTISAIPEPATMILMGLGVLGTAIARRRSQTRSC